MIWWWPFMRHNLPATLSVPQTLGMDSHRVGEVVSAVQAALDNVERHAKASHTWISVEEGEREVTVVVRDDGVGLPTVNQLLSWS